MIFVAMAFIAVGYPLAYWGANQIVHWNKSVTDTEAATLALLFGLPMPPDYKTLHEIPFPYKAMDSSSGGTTPSSNSGGTGSNNGGAGLSPNYPGGSGTIPTPGIPGTVPPSGGAYV